MKWIRKITNLSKAVIATAIFSSSVILAVCGILAAALMPLFIKERNKKMVLAIIIAAAIGFTSFGVAKWLEKRKFFKENVFLPD